MSGLEQKIISYLAEQGPQLGGELRAATSYEAHDLWRLCHGNPLIVSEPFGCRYLRLDKRLDGYARLSPSILREFLTYTVLGLPQQAELIHAQAQALYAEIMEISRYKRRLATTFIQDLVTEVEEHDFHKHYYAKNTQAPFCALLAGDIVYRMAHAVPRAERSTGKIVRGSDLDMVVITADECPADYIKLLDRSLYQLKYMALVRPDLREELDYIIKPLRKVERQAQFDSFTHRVACKILHESEYVWGAKRIYERAKQLLAEYGVPQRLAELEQEAHRERKNAIAQLLQKQQIERKEAILFFPVEESEEYESMITLV